MGNIGDLLCVLFSAFVICSGLSGCIRYVPPASELESNARESSQGEGDSSLQGINVAGPTEFYQYEEEIQSRLQKLVKIRKPLLRAGRGGGYVLGAGDTFSITVFQFPELNQEAVTVSQEGTVSLPLVGDYVKVGGKTVPELRNHLRYLYRDYIVNPNIIITLKDIHSAQVSVTGAVAKPGVYPLRDSGMVVNDVLALAGGRTDRAGNRILVMPSPARAAVEGIGNTSSVGPRRAVEIWYEDLIGDVNSTPVILPVVHGDSIVVPEAGTYEVDGEVYKPGSYSLRKKTTAASAVASAGGFTYGAKVDEVEVIRDIGSGRKALIALNLEEIALKGKQDVRLRDGDIVRIPTASGRHFKRQIVETLNGVFRGVGVTARN
jgi:polysaccharide export outer membrane protein